MRCLKPISIKNPLFDKRMDVPMYIQVPCGKCPACLITKRSDWYSRFQVESRHSAVVYFVTLTYSGDNPKFDKKHIQDFHKRLRKRLDSLGVKMRFYLGAEYGSQTLRPHYHSLYFLDGFLSCDVFRSLCETCWSYGFISCDFSSPARMNYVAKYLINPISAEDLSNLLDIDVDCPDDSDKDKIVTSDGVVLDKPFAMMSRNPGIGYQYVQECKNNNFYRPYYRDNHNSKRHLSRFYVDRIFSDRLRNIKRKEELDAFYESNKKNITPEYWQSVVEYFEEKVFKQNKKSLI